MAALPSIWVVGDWDDPMFEGPVLWLKSRAAYECFKSAAAACGSNTHSTNGEVPRAIILMQSRPGQFAGREVEELHAQYPLARLLSLIGPWCEGEQRSGRPVPGVVRIAWRQWRQRLELELAADENASRV